MEKEDILLKSKNDNRKGDEPQVQNKQNAEMFGYGSVMFVLVILINNGQRTGQRRSADRINDYAV